MFLYFSKNYLKNFKNLQKIFYFINKKRKKFEKMEKRKKIEKMEIENENDQYDA